MGCMVEGTFLCKSCFDNLEIARQICPSCGRYSALGWVHGRCKKKNGLDGLICIYSYSDEVVRKAIDEIKFGFNQSLVELMMEGFRFESGMDFDAVVPIPLYFYRENWRGFNQAELIAGLVAREMKVKMERYLVRIKNTKQQSAIKSKRERRVNLKNAFRLKKGYDPAGKKILIVDDVFTSGASMKEATAELKKNGASAVWGLVLAH